jgi:NhaA family Na+:H+ antiporter
VSASQSGKKRPFQILREYSIFLISGSVTAILWANIDLSSYHAFIETSLGNIFLFGREVAEHGYTLHFLVNEAFMVLFFGIAMKEVVEAFLPGGPLGSKRAAGLPIISTLGGVVGPAGLFAIGCLVFANYLIRGWAVPTATDIAYSWLFAGMIFGYKHPTTKFLLALAVLDDLIGMIIIAVFYSESIHVEWLSLVALGMALCALFRWVVKVDNHWPYLLVGIPLSWLGLHYTGVHAALALVPIVPFMPHERRDVGMFAEEDQPRHATDALNLFEHQFKPFVDVGLFFFGLTNAGVPFSAIGKETWITVAAIFVGKTFGIYLFTVIGRLFRLGLPAGMKMKEAFVMGNVAAIGFTVALFVTDVAFKNSGDAHAYVAPGAHAIPVAGSDGHPDANPTDTSHPPPLPERTARFDELTPPQQGVVKDKVKMGALLSFFAGLTSWTLGRLLRVRKIQTDADLERAIREG